MDEGGSENSTPSYARGPSGSMMLLLSMGSIPGLPLCFGVSENRPLFMEISFGDDVLSLQLRQGAAFTTSAWRLTSWSRESGRPSKPSGPTSEALTEEQGTLFTTT